MLLRNLLAVSVASLALAAPTLAQDYPTDTVTLVVPYAAGGGTDTAARLIVPSLEAALGKPLIIANIDGAGGAVGAAELANSEPNGYMIGYLPVGTTTTQPHLRKVDYGSDSWEPICMVLQDPMALLVAPDSPIQSLDDLTAAVAGGQELKSAGPAPGSLPHIGQAALANSVGATFRYVPHEGAGAVAKSLLGGQVDITVDVVGLAETYGLNPVVLLSDKRHELYPDLPTMAEAGGEALSQSIWYGIFAPAGTPANVVSVLSAACDQAANSEEYATAVNNAKRTARFMGSEEFTTFFAREYEGNAMLLEQIGLKQ